jgi:hypothetical protein
MKNKHTPKILSFTIMILMLLALMPAMTSLAQAAATEKETPDTTTTITPASTITEETIVLEQNFDGLTQLPEDWTAHYGEWHISNGKLYQNYITSDTSDYPLPLITFDNVGYLENFRFEATIQFENQGTFIAWMGLGFDILNFDTPYPSPLQLAAAGVYSYGVDFRTMNIIDPAYPFPTFGPSNMWPKDPFSDSFHLTIEVYGDSGDIYFDGTLMVANVEIQRQTDGTFGLITEFGAAGSYDDIKITSLPYRLPSITTENLLDGTTNLPYRQKLVSEGDKIVWSKIDGTLPNGLSLSNNGIISGTPLSTGTFTFTVKAENAKDKDTKEFSITINPTYTTSFSGNGVDFTSGDVELVSTNKLSTAPKTFEAWIKLPTTSQGIGVITGNGAIDGFNGLATINFGVTTDGNPWLYWKETNGNEVNYTAYANVKLDDWVHVAIIQDNENHKITCYVNGAQADEQTSSIMEDTLPVRPLKIGGDYLWDNVRCFPGEIADIRIWSIVRTQSEIQANMNEPLTGNEEGLLANWMLNEKINDVYKDTSTQGNNARIWNEWLEPEFAEGDYTIAVIPDIQFLTFYHQDVLNSLFNWIQNNAEARNIQFVIQVGDLTDKNTVVEWQLVKDNFNKLDDAGVSYVFIPGNHDYKGMPSDRDTELFNTYLPYAIYSQTSIFGGSYENDKLDNAYYYFTTTDTTYLMLCLEMVPRDPVLDWANKVVTANSDCRAIVITHAYLSSDGSYDVSSGYDTNGNSGQAIWDKFVSQHANIIMVLCGHIHYDDLVMRIDTGIYGNEVPQLLVDAQDMDYYHEGVGMIALLTFNNGGRNVAVNWYSVKEDKLFRDWNQFTFSVEQEIKPTIVSITPTASVKQLNGNKNELTITLTELYSDGTTNILSQTFSINNNAADNYTVGTYRVYVDTKGNTQIRVCYII